MSKATSKEPANYYIPPHVFPPDSKVDITMMWGCANGGEDQQVLFHQRHEPYPLHWALGYAMVWLSDAKDHGYDPACHDLAIGDFHNEAFTSANEHHAGEYQAVYYTRKGDNTKHRDVCIYIRVTSQVPGWQYKIKTM